MDAERSVAILSRHVSASRMIAPISSSHDGRSSISPATCPDDINPRSVRPSTMAARSSTGVFAAISTCPQLSPPSRRMSRPAAADRTARTRPPAIPPETSRSTILVRSTRCGTPSTRVVTTVPSRPAAR